jgi:hypothetical protein
MAFEDPRHLRRRPMTTAARGRDALVVQACCDGPQARFPGRLWRFHRWADVRSPGPSGSR